MPPIIRDLRVDQMSADQRLLLINEIWDSLSAESGPIPESHRDELDRRLEAADADPLAARSWEEVRDRLRS